MCCGHLYLLCQCLWARCASVRVLAVPTRADTSAAAVLLEDIVILVPCWGGQALGGRRAWRWRRWHALAAAEVTDEGSDDHRLPLAVAQGGVKRRSAQAKERGEQVHREGESAGVICSGEVSHAREDLQNALAHVEAVGAVDRLSPS